MVQAQAIAVRGGRALFCCFPWCGFLWGLSRVDCLKKFFDDLAEDRRAGLFYKALADFLNALLADLAHTAPLAEFSAIITPITADRKPMLKKLTAARNLPFTFCISVTL